MNEPAWPLKVPVRALPLILLQRPMLQRLQSRAMRLGIPLSWRLTLETLLRSRAVEEDFIEMMQCEYESIRAELPAAPTRILDIGCGVAAIDALLFRHYSGRSDLEFILLDRSELAGPPRYGFSTRREFYNSLSVARTLLRTNGVSLARVHTLEAPDANPCRLPAADLIVSLASWGFHYPVSTYLEPTWNALSVGGVLILDVRAGLGEEEVLADRFPDAHPLCKVFEGKATRYAARKGTL